MSAVSLYAVIIQRRNPTPAAPAFSGRVFGKRLFGSNQQHALRRHIKGTSAYEHGIARYIHSTLDGNSVQC